MEEKELKILTCYHCGNTGLMRVEGEYKTKRGGPIRDEGNNIVDYDPVERVEMQLLSCPVCHEVTLYKEVFNEEYGFTDTLEYCYPNIRVKHDAAIPEHIKTAYEAVLKVKNIDEPMCLIGLRRVLEAICKDKGAEGKDLSKMVNDLVNKNVLPEMLDDACWVVRQLGNSAAHGDQTDFYRYEVERATEFVGALIDYIYVLPNRISRFKQKVEEKLKDKNEKSE